MPITVELTGGSLEELRFSTADLMREVGLLARERIIRRTAAGVDAQGAAFTAYSPAYGKRKAKELGASPVNLMVSGNMLGSITLLEVTERSVTVGLSN